METRVRLERRGLLLRAGPRIASRLLMLLLLPLIVIGLARARFGIADDGTLAVLLITVGALVLALVLGLVIAPRRTLAGSRVVAALHPANAHLAPDRSPSFATYGPAAAAMGVALFGAASLSTADPAFAEGAELPYLVSSGLYRTSADAASGCGGCGG